MRTEFDLSTKTKPTALNFFILGFIIQCLVYLEPINRFYWCAVVLPWVAHICVIVGLVLYLELVAPYLIAPNAFVRYVIYTCVYVLIVVGTTCADRQTNEVETISGDNIYIAYAPSCSYCRIAHEPALTAMRVYNASHMKAVRFVNLDKDTPASRELVKHIDKKGSIVAYYKGEAASGMYTLKSPEGKPVKPSPQFVYEQLQEVSDLVRSEEPSSQFVYDQRQKVSDPVRSKEK